MIRRYLTSQCVQWLATALSSVALCLALLLSATPCSEAGAQSSNWPELKGKHFIVYFQGENRTFPSEVLRKAEAYYDEIAGVLGYARRSEFWLWENRCSIYLY